MLQTLFLLFKNPKCHKYATPVNSVFLASSVDCRQCPLSKSCGGAACIKTIEDAVTKDLNDQMHHRMQSGKGKRMQKLRSSTVEPVLGTLISFGSITLEYFLGLLNLQRKVVQQPPSGRPLSIYRY